LNFEFERGGLFIYLNGTMLDGFLLEFILIGVPDDSDSSGPQVAPEFENSI